MPAVIFVHWIRLIVGVSLVLALVPAQALGVEQAPTVAAKDVFPETALNGDHYRVEPDVPTDGFLTRAVIESDFGRFVAVGPGMLEVRLREIEALAKLETLESSEEFKRGMKESANEKAGSLKQLVENPKETAEGVGEGVGRFFKRAGRAAKTGIQKTGDVLQDKSPGAPDEAGPGAALPGQAQSQAPAGDANKLATVARASGDAAVNILGFDDARRRLAKRLQVDPYTTNPVLDEKLDEVARSIFLGDLAVDVATSLIPGGIIASRSAMVTDWVWDTSPGDLRVEIDKSLRDMGVSQEDVDRLLRHRWYPLSYQAALTRALESMQGVEGRAAIMPLALSVTTVDQARFVVHALGMASRYHGTIRPLRTIEVSGTIVATDQDGTLVVMAPVDYLSWNSSMEGFSGRDDFAGHRVALHLAGALTDQARRRLEDLGWVVSEDSPLAGLGSN